MPNRLNVSPSQSRGIVMPSGNRPVSIVDHAEREQAPAEQACACRLDPGAEAQRGGRGDQCSADLHDRVPDRDSPPA